LTDGQIKSPSTCCLVGFGGGLTWGAAIIRWNAVDKRLSDETEEQTNTEKTGAKK
jgi:hypothetical protein